MIFLNQNTKILIHGNAPEDIVCDMAAILSRERWRNVAHKVGVDEGLIQRLYIQLVISAVCRC